MPKAKFRDPRLRGDDSFSNLKFQTSNLQTSGPLGSSTQIETNETLQRGVSHL